MVECGGLENRFTRNPGDEGSNPSSSASFTVSARTSGRFSFQGPQRGIRTDAPFTPAFDLFLLKGIRYI